MSTTVDKSPEVSRSAEIARFCDEYLVQKPDPKVIRRIFNLTEEQLLDGNEYLPPEPELLMEKFKLTKKQLLEVVELLENEGYCKEIRNRVLNLLRIRVLCASQVSIELLIRPRKVWGAILMLKALGLVEMKPDSEKDYEYEVMEVPWKRAFGRPSI
ncbi:MAG: hypothetical protein KJ970_15875 [Candidatus Eisenbacteria bacterium]|uniref:Uncharacterized protein n=1 Tax=Eiseniibacteriota bacterium TaxID=2212470 RepID=A0A948RZC5_UNCEI|nr:hypothetical protein [Candidatus Eisenbacteria bacterium]MBU1950047.1 hypothetical protein [Candidatus Eisenbacteria bacterium]MBU2692402.1 hypothetical protein [Candidatus Eisenbacteria bacterium]